MFPLSAAASFSCCCRHEQQDCSLRLLATVLNRVYFRVQLPDPLIPFELYKKFVTIGDEHPAGKSQERCRLFRELLAKVPKINHGQSLFSVCESSVTCCRSSYLLLLVFIFVRHMTRWQRWFLLTSLALLGVCAALLKYLCRFLVHVASREEVNKMTPQNLAIVFAPNLLRPKVTNRWRTHWL